MLPHVAVARRRALIEEGIGQGDRRNVLRVGIFGKLGIASTKVETEANLSGFGITGEERRNSLLGGFGVQYFIWRNLGVRAEFENWGEVGNETNTGRAKMDTWNLQAVFTF